MQKLLSKALLICGIVSLVLLLNLTQTSSSNAKGNGSSKMTLGDIVGTYDREQSLDAQVSARQQFRAELVALLEEVIAGTTSYQIAVKKIEELSEQTYPEYLSNRKFLYPEHDNRQIYADQLYLDLEMVMKQKDMTESSSRAVLERVDEERKQMSLLPILRFKFAS